MLFILEVWLTIKAWRKGWKARALIPGAILGPLAFLIGVTMDVAPDTAGHVLPIFFMIDLAYIGVMVGMVKTRPAWVTTQSVSQLAPLPVATSEGLNT